MQNSGYICFPTIIILKISNIEVLGVWYRGNRYNYGDSANIRGIYYNIGVDGWLAFVSKWVEI